MKQTNIFVAGMLIAVAGLLAVGNVRAASPESQPQATPESVLMSDDQPAEMTASGCEQCCVPRYCIEYRQHRQHRRICCGCGVEPFTAMLQITDPCRCCPVEVPVCVPGCCTGTPSVSCRQGLFGRTITEYTWCCGFRVRMVLTRRNEIIVHTYGS
jgi:hypothetical protein